MKKENHSKKTASLLKELFDNLMAIDRLFKDVEALEVTGRKTLPAKVKEENIRRER